MSRAYGLFAHLVSVAGDRAFLHYRFGATCTFTSQRLNEAIEHLEIARELGFSTQKMQRDGITTKPGITMRDLNLRKRPCI